MIDSVKLENYNRNVYATETTVRYLMLTGCVLLDKCCTSCVECQREKLMDSWFSLDERSRE